MEHTDKIGCRETSFDCAGRGVVWLAILSLLFLSIYSATRSVPHFKKYRIKEADPCTAIKNATTRCVPGLTGTLLCFSSGWWCSPSARCRIVGNFPVIKYCAKWNRKIQVTREIDVGEPSLWAGKLWGPRRVDDSPIA